MDSRDAPIVTGEPCFDPATLTTDPCFHALQRGELPADTVRAVDDGWSSMSRDELRLIQAALQRAQQRPSDVVGDSAFTAAAQHRGLGGFEPASTTAENQTLRESEPAASSSEHAGLVLVGASSERESPVAEAPSAAAAAGPPQDDGRGVLGDLVSPPNPLLTQIRKESRSCPQALKAAIPAEVLLRQQGRAGFSNRTQIATLLEAAVGFIEGMREYKRDLQRQLLAS
ncbi:unnamed protein product [Closterium sp. Naga37s-1]|nr:unnamed protein product [Closterium sp. Naga37s-1]